MAIPRHGEDVVDQIIAEIRGEHNSCEHPWKQRVFGKDGARKFDRCVLCGERIPF